MSQTERREFSNEIAQTLAEYGKSLSDEDVLDIVSTVVATYCVLKEIPQDTYMDYFEENYELAARVNGVILEEPIQILYGPPGEA